MCVCVCVCLGWALSVAATKKGFAPRVGSNLQALTADGPQEFLSGNLYKSWEYWCVLNQSVSIFDDGFAEIPHSLPQVFSQ